MSTDITVSVCISREGSTEVDEAGRSEQLDVDRCVLRAGVQLRAAGDARHLAHHGPVRVEQATGARVHGRAHVSGRRARLRYVRYYWTPYQHF